MCDVQGLIFQNLARRVIEFATAADKWVVVFNLICQHYTQAGRLGRQSISVLHYEGIAYDFAVKARIRRWNLENGSIGTCETTMDVLHK